MRTVHLPAEKIWNKGSLWDGLYRAIAAFKAFTGHRMLFLNLGNVMTWTLSLNRFVLDHFIDKNMNFLENVTSEEVRCLEGSKSL